MGRKKFLKRINENIPGTKEAKEFSMVYDYEFGQDIYPKFKILYDSKSFLHENAERKLKRCLRNFFGDFRDLYEQNIEDEEINYLVECIRSTDKIFNGRHFPNLEKFIDTKCKMIPSENDTSLGTYDWTYDKKMDKHLFYRINFSPNFALELEGFSPKRIDEVDNKDGITVRFFEDERLNQIVEKFRFNPDHLSFFIFRQIAPNAAADVVFKKVYDIMKDTFC